MSERLEIRDYRASDAKALTDIFYHTIHNVGREYYSLAQVNAWAPYPIDYERWKDRLTDSPPIVAVIKGEPVGFITLSESGYIDLAYTHKDHQRKGVASILYTELEQRALNQDLQELSVHASYFAKPLFEKLGFIIEKKNSVNINGQNLTNFLMNKAL